MRENRYKKVKVEYLSDEQEWLQFRNEALQRSDEELKVVQLAVAQWAEEQSQQFCN